MITGIGPLHSRIAGLALTTAGRYGFALGGGCALVAHGLVDRTTEDVDLFTDEDGGVRTATSLVLAVPDEPSTFYSLSTVDVDRLRAAFAGWPRR